ncbi:MAG: hypothetical protein R2819_03575 [Allomuricauda sp.]
MKINWKYITSKDVSNLRQVIDLEYALRLQVIKILIQEAEHLLDYLSLVVMEVDMNEHSIRVGDETPEPLYTLIQRNSDQFEEIMDGEMANTEKTLVPSYGVF